MQTTYRHAAGLACVRGAVVDRLPLLDGAQQHHTLFLSRDRLLLHLQPKMMPIRQNQAIHKTGNTGL